MLKHFAVLLFFFGMIAGQSTYSQQVVFPEVLLKNVPTDVQVQSDVELDYLILNKDTVPLSKTGEHYVMIVSLPNNNIHFENANVEYDQPRSEERRVGKECRSRLTP